MPPKSRFRNKKNKNNNSPYQHPNANPKPSHPNHPASNTHQKNHHNRGRSASRTPSTRSPSRKSFRQTNRPSTHKPKRFHNPTHDSHAPHSAPSSPDRNLASKATHTLRSTLLSSTNGILKRRISLGLSLALPSSAASARIKSLLLQAIDDARSAVGRMDFDMSSASPQNMAAGDEICPGAPNGKGTPGAVWGEEEGGGLGDSGIGMAMDTDVEEDVWETDMTPVFEDADHGCVDIVREHGKMVERMRWEATDPPAFGSGPPTRQGGRGRRVGGVETAMGG